MKKRNLSAKKKIHNYLIKKLKNIKIKDFFFKFEKFLKNNYNKKICIAISGGPDSMALAYLSKLYSLKKKKIKFFYYTVDHKLRNESSKEAKQLKSVLKKFDINCKILTWKGKKPSKNIQSIAREKRYQLLFRECKKNNIDSILTAHHQDDLFENFFIRILRGSGLKGLISFSKLITKINKSSNIYILRPLLNFTKKDLLYITKNTFNFSLRDPSNDSEDFLRIKIRKLLILLQKEGLNSRKFRLTLENLNKSNLSIEYYVDQNIKNNSKILINNKSIILNKNFFYQPDEIVFRSFSQLIHKVGNKKNYPRGNKVINLLSNFKSNKNYKKMTLSGCAFEKINNSMVISREIK